MRWNQRISQNGSTISSSVQFDAYTYQFYKPMPICGECPTYGEHIAKMLDSKITIVDAGKGLILYEGTLMDLALLRIREAGLVQNPNHARIGVSGELCYKHLAPVHEVGSVMCDIALEIEGKVITDGMERTDS